jgi:tRNA dimethylallyltransferase
MEQGFLAEVEALSVRPLGLSRTARQAIGYRELLGVVEEGHELDAAVEATVSRTRGFSRRQRSWFRRDPRVHWELDHDSACEVLVHEIVRVAVGLEVGE